ncbi:MAG: RidA family protein [Chloroflexi bacterium]|nr:RidA family protein [Chloroflexota bacterium]
MHWQPINPPNEHQNPAFSQAARVGDLVFAAGQAARDPSGNIVRGSTEVQATRVFEKLSHILTAVGGSFQDILRLDSYYVPGVEFAAVRPVRAKFMPGMQVNPPSVGITVHALADPAFGLEIEAIIGLGPKEHINSPREFRTPFIDAIKMGNIIVLSGHTSRGRDGVVLEGDLVVQTQRIYEKFQNILSAAGASMGDIVKINKYYTRGTTEWERTRIAQMQAAVFFPPSLPPPAATGVTIGALALPQWDVEMSAIAVLGPKKAFNSPKEWHPPFVTQAMRAGNLVFTAGQTARDINGNLVGPGDTAKQAEVIFAKLANNLAEAGCTLRDVAKLNIYVAPGADLKQLREVRARSFPKDSPPPAMTLAVVKSLGGPSYGSALPGMLVEVDAVAVAG